MLLLMYLIITTKKYKFIEYRESKQTQPRSVNEHKLSHIFIALYLADEGGAFPTFRSRGGGGGGGGSWRGISLK